MLFSEVVTAAEDHLASLRWWQFWQRRRVRRDLQFLHEMADHLISAPFQTQCPRSAYTGLERESAQGS